MFKLIVIIAAAMTKRILSLRPSSGLPTFIVAGGVREGLPRQAVFFKTSRRVADVRRSSRARSEPSSIICRGRYLAL